MCPVDDSPVQRQLSVYQWGSGLLGDSPGPQSEEGVRPTRLVSRALLRWSFQPISRAD